MKTDVIIPAWNEQTTISAVIDACLSHPDVGKVIVSIDPEGNDETGYVAQKALHGYGFVVYSLEHGKGQTVSWALACVNTKRVAFIDADLIGFTTEHFDQVIRTSLTEHDSELIIGVPDFPAYENVPPGFLGTLHWAWPWVSGQRSMLTRIARAIPMHGYLMETQINNACHKQGIPHRFERLHGLTSPLTLDQPRRLEEMERDRQWGIDNGVLPS